MAGLKFCNSQHWTDVIIALCLTYTPMFIYVIKFTRGRMLAFLHLLAFLTCCFSFGYLVHDHYKDINKVAFGLGAAATLMWAVYAFICICKFVRDRVRMCCLGRHYIFAPANHVETPSGVQPITPSGNKAFVVTKPGLTSVNGELVSGLKRLVIGGKVATKTKPVVLSKYGR